MDIQNTPEPRGRYPLFTTDIEVKRREILHHTSLTGESEEIRELQELQASASGTVLPPALSIVSEEEEAAASAEIYAIARVRQVKAYSYKLVCCRNQLGIGMSNPGPR